MVQPEADVTGEHEQAAGCNWRAAAEADATGEQQLKRKQLGSSS